MPTNLQIRTPQRLQKSTHLELKEVQQCTVIDTTINGRHLYNRFNPQMMLPGIAYKDVLE